MYLQQKHFTIFERKIIIV